MTTDRRPADRKLEGDLDPGAFIGHEPELEEESIPGGVRPGDERVAAYGSQAGADGEPDRIDIIEGPIGGASLRDPAEIEAENAGVDLVSLPDVDEPARRESAGR